MNKTLFKRSLTFATSAALALGSMLPTVSSAAAGLNVDTAVLTNVPVVAAEMPAPQVVIESASPVKAGESNWNDVLDAGVATLPEVITVEKARFENIIRKALATGNVLSDATIDKMMNKVTHGTAVVNNGKIGDLTMTAEIGDCGPIVAEALYKKLEETGDLQGQFDFSNFVVKGTVVANAKLNYEEKTVSYTVTFTDEDGEEYLIDEANDGAYKYATKKYNQLLEIVKEVTTDPDQLKRCEDFYNKLEKAGDSALDKVDSFTATASSFDEAYAALKAKATEIIESNDKVSEKAPEIPATWQDVITAEKYGVSFDTAIEFLNSVDKVNIDITAQDVIDVAASAYSVTIAIDGADTDITFLMEDDQNAEYAEAYIEKYANDAYLVDNNLKITEVKTYKKVILLENAGENSVFFDVERYIELVTEEVTETTETTETTTETTETTTETTETTTETTETTTETTETTTKSTETTTETTETTTETTETTPEGGETSDTTTSTTPATYISFEFADMADNGLVYWSEEDKAFDLSKLTVMMHFVIGGEAEEGIDVSNAFKPEGNSPSELGMVLPEGVGIAHYPVGMILTDYASIEAKVVERFGEEAAALIDQAELAQDAIGCRFTVTLVLRGDTNLDGEIGAEDAQQCLNTYVHRLGQQNLQYIFDLKGIIPNWPEETHYKLFPYAHYAADVIDGKGELGPDDAQTILNYYVADLAQNNPTWETINSVKLPAGHDPLPGVVEPLDILHYDPLTYAPQSWQDEYAAAIGK